jgi:hypothetical protein
MSFHRISSKVFFGLAFVAGMLSFITAPASAAARHSLSVCDQATVLDLDATARLSRLPAGDSYLRIEVPAPGVLSLDASVPGSSRTVPVLVPVSASCDGAPSARPIVLERTLASLLLGIESPGNYVFRLTSSDPSKTLSEVKVRTGHSSFGEDEDEIENEPDPFAGHGTISSFGEDEDEIENEPDPFAGHGTISSFGEDEDEIENEPDPFVGGHSQTSKSGEDEDEIENEPDPFAGGDASVLLRSVQTEICALGELDDYGDTFGCAAALRPQVTVQGEIGNGWGDDADVFRFVLSGSEATDLWRVEVVTSGDAEIVGTLFDRSGERLSQAVSDGSGGNLGLIRILRPGVYFVRVEGSQQAEGSSYRLKLEVSAP